MYERNRIWNISHSPEGVNRAGQYFKVHPQPAKTKNRTDLLEKGYLYLSPAAPSLRAPPCSRRKHTSGYALIIEILFWTTWLPYGIVPQVFSPGSFLNRTGRLIRSENGHQFTFLDSSSPL